MRCTGRAHATARTREIINLRSDGPCISGVVQSPERIAALARQGSGAGETGRYRVVAAPEMTFSRVIQLWELLTQNGQRSVGFQTVGEPTDIVVSVVRPQFYRWASVVKMFANGCVNYTDSPKTLATEEGRADMTSIERAGIGACLVYERLLRREHLAESVVYVDPTECAMFGQFADLLQAVQRAGIREVFWITIETPCIRR